MTRKRVAVLISGRGSNMTALMRAAAAPDYPAQISLVLSNRADAGGLTRATQSSIATAIVDHTLYGKDREAFERKLHVTLEEHQIDFVCLAGFMRILSPWLVSRWQNRMLNIHPSLLPDLKGLHTHERALEAGVSSHGATVHFVVPDLDAGPIIAQGAVPVLPNDTADILAARVLDIEHCLYPLALRLVSEGRVRVVEGHCVIDGHVSADEAQYLPGAKANDCTCKG